MHIDHVIFLALSNIAYTKFSAVPVPLVVLYIHYSADISVNLSGNLFLCKSKLTAGNFYGIA